MSNVYLVRTNQKLNFARIHMDALAASHQSTGWSKHAEIESFNESVLFHLASAYASFLREVAERYRFDPAKVSRLADLKKLIEAAGVESPELVELESLQFNESSWLNNLLGAYGACWQAANTADQPSDGSKSISEIHVVQINPNHAEDQEILAEYRRWLDQFRQLIERLRMDMQEW